MIRVQISVVTILLALLSPDGSFAKAWRNIIPLRSTRADVERLLGKPNKLGRYEIENEKAYIFYSEGKPVEGLAGQKCEGVVPKDTVLRIAVTLEDSVSFRRVDRNRFTRKMLNARLTMATYSDLNDGLVYTVRESDEMITAISYWPSATDCKLILDLQNIDLQKNAWRDIRPLHTTRKEVEQILGPSKRQSLNGTYLYTTPKEKVDVLYSGQPCDDSVVGSWNVPPDTVLRIIVYPQLRVPLDDLRLDKNRYSRGLDPNIPNSYFWVSRDRDVMIHSQLDGALERVLSIALSGSRKDRTFVCQ